MLHIAVGVTRLKDTSIKTRIETIGMLHIALGVTRLKDTSIKTRIETPMFF